jgi:organic hydroperoxide reductase OsmC/OhrA
VPLPFSDETAVDPEEAYVAALASCHMLGFLYFAARRGFVVTSYRDQPSGVMGKDESGREYITNVSLAPRVVFAADHAPADSDVEALHHEAHEACYLANSVKTTIDIHGGWERETPERKEYESRTSGAQ